MVLPMILEKIKDSSLVDLLAVITPFVIIMGLMHKIGIYTSEQVDASWFISIFSPVDFMISDLSIYFYFTIALFYLEKVIFSSGKNNLSELFWSNVMLFSAFFGIVLLLFITHKAYMPMLKFYMYSALSLNGFGLIILGERFLKILGVSLILLVPYFSGLEHAKKLTEQSLPIVDLEDKKTWYLLDKHSNQLVLINSMNERNEFKIIEMKELKLIKEYIPPLRFDTPIE